MQSMGLIYSQTDTTPSKPLGMRVRLVPGELSAIYLDANPTLSKTTLEAALLGEHELMYVYNADASAFAYGDCVTMSGVTNVPYNGVLVPAAATTLGKEHVLGFALGAIPAGSYGWIVTKGVTYARTDNTGAAQLAVILTIYQTAVAGQVRTGALTTANDFYGHVGVGVTNAAATAGARFLIQTGVL